MTNIQVAEQFHSIQGEGPHAGTPAVFLRFAGCNLRCIGHRPGQSVPKVSLSRGGKKKLKDIEPGDKLSAYDSESDGLAETEVQSVMKKEKKKWLQIKLEEGTQKLVGHEHPFLTESGWKEAKNIEPGDEIMWFSGSDEISLQKKIDNPMSRDEVAKKKAKSQDYDELSRKIQQIRSEETWNSWDPLSDEEKERLSQEQSKRMKGEKNPANRFPERNPFNDSEVQKEIQQMDIDYNPTVDGQYISKVEKRFHEICKERGFTVEYVGNRQLIIETDEGDINPDFVLPNGDVIEVYSSSFPYYDRGDGWEEKRRKLIEDNSDRDVIFVDVNSQAKISDSVDKVVSQAPRNGVTVTEVNEQTCEPYCDKEYSAGPLEVYDLVCEPYPTFLLETGPHNDGSLVTHNCGAVDRELDDVNPVEDEPSDGATWICDTIPEWKEPEHTYQPEELYNEFVDRGWAESLAGGRSHLILTGGEPTLPNHQQGMIEFLRFFYLEFGTTPFVEVETNGTNVPQTVFNEYVDGYNVSLKLSNSGHDKNRRIQKDAMEFYAGNDDAIWKFVVSRSEDVDEIEEIVDEYGLDKRRVYLMPAGMTQDQLDDTYTDVMDLCESRGYRFSPRLHVSAYNEQTGV